MIMEEVNKSLWNAFETLRIAEQELQRPNEDVVALCACQCTRISAEGFFRSYLLSKSPEKNENESLSDLLDECAKLDSHFSTIDLSCFNCKNTNEKECDKKYCLSVDKVNECFEQTHIIRNLVLSKLKLSEKDFS